MKSLLKTILITCALIQFFPINLFAVPIVDLTEYEMFAKRGFSKDWIKSLPHDGSWIKIPPGTEGQRKVRVSEINFPDIPKRKFLSIKKDADETYTFITSFTFPEGIDIQEKFSGLFLAQIGMNWEIYLNGHLIRSEMHLSPNGQIESSRNMRDLLEYISPSYLKEGENILAFHIVGEPHYPETGLYWNGPYVIDEYKKLLNKKSETIPLILISIYLFLGIYHLFLYSKRTKEKSNLYYGLFSILIFIYIFTRTHTVYSVISNTTLITQIELISLYTIFPAGGLFIDSIIKEKGIKFLIGYTIFCSVLILFTVPFPLAFKIDILRIWQFTAIIPLLYLFYIMGKNFIAEVKKFEVIQNGVKISLSLPSKIFQTLSKTFIGNILIGFHLLTVCVIFDIVDAVYLATGIGLSKYGFSLLMIGITFLLANRFQFIHGQIEELNISLQKKIIDLDKANIMITLSEEKYRRLIEGTDDIIFSLDHDWRFLTVSRSVKKHLHFNPEDLISKKFFEILHENRNAGSISHQFIQEKLDEFSSTKNPVQFKAEFKSLTTGEPTKFHVRLECIDIEGKDEILGKASRKMEDSLLKYFISEYQKFEIGNYLITAEEISYRITRNLERYIDQNEVNMIRIALREIIINSIEHGNLDISFEEKTEMMKNNKLFEIISKKQNDPMYINKRIRIEYYLAPNKVIYKISDEGKGFDYKKFYNKDTEPENSSFAEHGRGIIMAKSTFDEIKYSNNGTKVILKKTITVPLSI